MYFAETVQFQKACLDPRQVVSLPIGVEKIEKKITTVLIKMRLNNKKVMNVFMT